MSCAVKKVMLKVGRYVSPDGVVIVTPSRLRTWAQNHKRLLQAKQCVPVDYDHPDDVEKANPISMSQYAARLKRRGAETTVGRMREFNLHPSGKAAEVVLSFSDNAVGEKALGNDVFLSPVIKDFWQDGHGNQYRDVITHMDLVVHPVDYSQEPFKPVRESGSGSIECALRLSLDVGAPKFYRLSQASEDAMDEEELKDMLDVSDEDMADEEVGEGASDDDDAGDSEGSELPADDGTEEMSVDGMIDDSLGDDAGFDVGAQIKADLEAAGIVAPQGADPIEDPLGFLSQLSAALRQKALSDAGSGGGASPVEMGGDEAGMSPEDLENLTTTQPNFATMSLRMGRLEEENRGLRETLVADKKAGLLRRIAGLQKTGRCTKEEAGRLIATIKSTRMSIDGAGRLKGSKVLEFIRSRETLPAGAAVPIGTAKLSLDRKSYATEQPEIVSGGVVETAEQAQRVNNEVAKRHPHLYR